MAEVVLQTMNITKRYGDLLAVAGLSLEVRSGEIFGFLGPNGAGKTTSINMMSGLMQPDEGQVRIHGEVLTAGRTDLRARVGVCPQEVVLWERLTCLEQLLFMGAMYELKPAAARERSLQLLEELDLIQKQHKLASTLSGGMKRRLNFAMALVHNPEILILDEPEAGLDPQSRVKLREYIKSITREKTVILTTHNMDEAERLADRVAIIDNGELLVLDSPEALKHSVGEGDVVEITLKNPPQSTETSFGELDERVTVTYYGETLQLRALNLVNLLPGILEKLNKAGYQPEEVRLRGNTLEDVFIRLTGRSLRE